MLCVWLNYEVLPNWQTITAHLHCKQLDRVYEKVKRKYPRLINNIFLPFNKTKLGHIQPEKQIKSFKIWKALQYSLIHHTVQTLLHISITEAFSKRKYIQWHQWSRSSVPRMFWMKIMWLVYESDFYASWSLKDNNWKWRT